MSAFWNKKFRATKLTIQQTITKYISVHNPQATHKYTLLYIYYYIDCRMSADSVVVIFYYKILYFKYECIVRTMYRTACVDDCMCEGENGKQK